MVEGVVDGAGWMIRILIFKLLWRPNPPSLLLATHSTLTTLHLLSNPSPSLPTHFPMSSSPPPFPSTRFSPLEFDELRSSLADFATDRDWDQFHTPRNLLLALTGEVGELAEIFQWRSEGDAGPGLPGFSPEQIHHVGEEISDCVMYLFRMATACGIDLSAAVREKLEKNAVKYPADKARGSAEKYTAYVGGGDQTHDRVGGGGEGGDEVGDEVGDEGGDEGDQE